MTIEDFLGSIRDAHGLPRDRTEPLRQALLAEADRTDAEVRHVNGSATALYSPTETAVVIGECRIRERLGADAGGVTFGGDDERGGKLRLRVLVPSADRDEAAAPLPQQPPEAWRPARQPQVLPVRDVRLLGGFVCVCRDAIDGEDLASVVRANGPLPADAVRDCILQVARSLGEIHRAGFAHGGLTAEQFLLDDDGTVRIQCDRPFRSFDPATATADVRSVCRLHAFLMGQPEDSADVSLPGGTVPADFDRLIALLEAPEPRQPSEPPAPAAARPSPANGHVKPPAAPVLEAPAPQTPSTAPTKSRGGAGLWIGLAVALVAVIALVVVLAGR